MITTPLNTVGPQFGWYRLTTYNDENNNPVIRDIPFLACKQNGDGSFQGTAFGTDDDGGAPFYVASATFVTSLAAFVPGTFCSTMPMA